MNFFEDARFVCVAAIAATLTMCTAAGAMSEKATAPADSAPVIRVTTNRQTALAPASIVATVHQDTAAVADREVCLFAQGPLDITRFACWQQGRPDVVVNRTLKLSVPGDYQVFAQAALLDGVVQSNSVHVLVAE